MNMVVSKTNVWFHKVLQARHFGQADDRHLFTDVLKWLPDSVKQELDEIEATNIKPFELMKQKIMTCRLLSRAPCANHRLSACSRDPVDVCFTGTICKDSEQKVVVFDKC